MKKYILSVIVGTLSVHTNMGTRSPYLEYVNTMVGTKTPEYLLRLELLPKNEKEACKILKDRK